MQDQSAHTGIGLVRQGHCRNLAEPPSKAQQRRQESRLLQLADQLYQRLEDWQKVPDTVEWKRIR